MFRTKSTAGLVAAGLFASASLLSVPAAADSGSADITDLFTKEVSVKSNGQSYTIVDASGLSFFAKIHIELDAGVAGRIKSWKTWLRFGKQGWAYNFWRQMSAHGVSKSYPWNARPKTVDRVESVAVPLGALQTFLVGQCNYLASQLRDQGLSNKAIFGQDREVQLLVAADFKFDSTGAGSGSQIIEATSPSPFKLVCKRRPVSQIPTVGGLSDTPTQVTQASMMIFEVISLNGACKVKLSNVIQTDRANKAVKFRYEFSSGKKSDVKTVMTDHAKTVMFVHQYDIPNGPGAETGQIRMVGVQPDFASPWRPYNLNCVADGPGGLAPAKKPTVQVPLGNGDLTARPKPGTAPKPALRLQQQKRRTRK